MQKYIQELQTELEKLRTIIDKIKSESEVAGGDHDPEAVADVVMEELQELRRLVSRDELTGIYNRRGFYTHMERAFESAMQARKNDSGRSVDDINFSIVFIDADNFKSVNDTYGHDAGDAVLVALGETLNTAVRDTDCVARFGGEEFVVALLGATEEVAKQKAEQIRAAITESVKVPDAPDHAVTASIGVASLDASDADDLDELVGYADKAMYDAKTNQGKNAVIGWSTIAGGAA